MSPATATKKEAPTKIFPFGIEIDHPRNADVMIQAIPGCKLRGAIKASKPVFDSRNGMARIPRGQAEGLGKYPDIPGMQIHVNPSELTYVIVDPLNDDEALLERIKQQMDEDNVFRTKNKLKGVATIEGTLDQHRMKTLCRELLHVIDNNQGKIVKGSSPSYEDVTGMAGRFLLNPGSRVYNQQPQFEDEFDAWADKIASKRD